MLAKHLLVVGFIVLVVLVARMIRRLNRARSASEQRAALRRLGLAAEGATALGALIVPLTAAAQWRCEEGGSDGAQERTFVSGCSH